MNLFTKREAMIYFEDRRCYVAKYDEKKTISELQSFDIPVNVVSDGAIVDRAQLYYLLKKTLEENDLTKSKALFIINSSQIVNRTMNVPSMTEKERRSLIENESPSLFPQDLDDYAIDSVDLKSDEDVHQLLITVCPEVVLEDYRALAKQCELKLLGILPFSTLCMEYAHRLGGGRVNFLGTSHLGFYYGHENRYFDRTEINDAMLDFMDRHALQMEDVLRIKEDTYDSRMSQVDRPTVVLDMQSAYYEALGHVEHMGGEFSLRDRQFMTGSVVESGIFRELIDDKTYRELSLSDLFASARDDAEAIGLFLKKKSIKGLNQNYYLPAAVLVLALAILVGSFVYGEKLKQQNRDLVVKSHEQETTRETMPSAEGGETQNAVDVADAITKIQSSAPDALTVTGIDYQDGEVSIRGETKDADAVQGWVGQLQDIFKAKVEEEPTATVADVIYFQLSVHLTEEKGNKSTMPDSSVDENGGIESDGSNQAPIEEESGVESDSI